ncbi:MAG: alpha-amylase family glycosyl hydrolase, partial [Alistipes sp.]
PCDWTDTAKLNYANRAVWQGQIDAMCFWLTDHAIDGFRCDMAMLVPVEFWHETARQLRALKPDLFLLDEAEQPDLFDHGTFDMCYAWELHHLMVDVAQQRQRVTAIRGWLVADDYPASAMRMLFTSNHDENSWSGSEFARLGAARRAMTAFVFVAPRCVPLLYTGQEVGYDHAFAFFDRDPLLSLAPNAETEFLMQLIRLRHAVPALAAGEQGGAMIWIGNNAEDCLLTFVRETEGSRVVAMLNLSPYAIHADFHTGIYAGSYTDALSGATVELAEHVECEMSAWNFRIFFVV